MTANLLQDRGDPHALSALLDRVSPDIVIAQELSPACAQVLEDSFEYHHLRPAHDLTGRGIATRFAAEFGDIGMPGRKATWSFLEVEGDLVRLVGMHLVNPIEFPWWRSVRLRTRQLEALFGWTASRRGDLPLIVAGDMNASPRWPAYRLMSERWTDLAVEAANSEGTDPEPTWGWRPGWPRMLRIDHVFGLGVRATDCRVVPIRGSDYHAVVVDLAIEPD